MTVYEDFQEQTVAMSKMQMENIRGEWGEKKKKRRLGIWDDTAKANRVKQNTRADSAPL
jgi:hypothetical protein